MKQFGRIISALLTGGLLISLSLHVPVYAAAATVNVYRFYSPITRHHFFTADSNEANYLETSLQGTWMYEGVAFTAFTYSVAAGCSAGQPVYRFYSAYTRSHFYTIDTNEKDALIALNNPTVWNYEGVAYCADTVSSATNYPLYRFYGMYLQDHFFTTDTNEKDSLIANAPEVWNYEGVAYYVPGL